VRLTRAGLAAEPAAFGEVRIARQAEPERAARRPRKRSGRGSGVRRRRAPAATSEASERARPPIDGALYTALVRWRTAEAKQRRVPAFRVLSNATLEGIAVARPRDERALLAVKGIGPTLAAKFGEALLALVRSGG
jgi:superfamily II DNA helicase RecQ